MKHTCQSPDSIKHKGVTLVEMSVVISVLVILVSATTFSVGAYKRWQYGLEAGETLKGIYQAQKLYLADNPTEDFGTTFDSDATVKGKIVSYMPTTTTVAEMPNQVPDEDGNMTINIIYTTVPPTVADPSGNASDGLWDVNE